MKETPKSCGCMYCRRGAHTKTGHFLRNHEERSFRRKVKQLLRRFLHGKEEEPDIGAAPRGERLG